VARLLLILLSGCRCGAAEPPPEHVLEGVCEASAVAESEGRLLVADNEVQAQLYSFVPGTLSASGSVALRAPIEDIEALVPSAGGLWVVGSHSRNQKGKAQPERAVIGRWPGGGEVRPDLSRCAPCREAEPLPPEEGGLNVEGGLVSAGHLWLGLRSPLVAGRALLVELELPADAPLPVPPASPAPGVRRVVELDLGGRGIREIVPARAGGWWIVAGPADGAQSSHALYRLATPEGPAVAVGVELPPGTEGLVDEGPTLLWFTDGKEPAVGGGACEEPSWWGRVPAP